MRGAHNNLSWHSSVRHAKWQKGRFCNVLRPDHLVLWHSRAAQQLETLMSYCNGLLSVHFKTCDHHTCGQSTHSGFKQQLRTTDGVD